MLKQLVISGLVSGRQPSN